MERRLEHLPGLPSELSTSYLESEDAPSPLCFGAMKSTIPTAMHEETGLELFRTLSRTGLAEKARAFERAMNRILGEQAAKGSLRSGGTLLRLVRHAEVELKERANLLIDAAQRVVEHENVETIDALGRNIKDIMEANISAAYAETWGGIELVNPVRDLAQSLATAIQRLQWSLADVRNEQSDRAKAAVDLFVRARKSRGAAVPTKAKRKLAVIVALDVASYSARTEQNETQAIKEVMDLRHLIDEIAKAHHGRVFNTAGDGFMLEFGAATDAVEAGAELAARCSPLVRVGVHAGDVSDDDRGGLLGHAVNVAARLQQRASPGGALVSIDVRRMIRDGVADRLVRRRRLKLAKMNETIDAFEISDASLKQST